MSWDIVKKKISENISIAIINIFPFNSVFKKNIDEEILSICYGKNYMDVELEYIKRKLYLSLTVDGKVKSYLKQGAIAEFFVHLYLRNEGFRQECFYLNMEEERGIKKGFDGFYSLESEEWIMECKSALSSTKKVSHVKKLKEAYRDLKNKKFSGENDENNPWQNAWSNAGHMDIQSNDSIIKKLKECSKKFRDKELIDISRFNLIPSSTIFIIDESYDEPDTSDLIKNIYESIDSMMYQKILLICITQKSLDIFVDYLKKEG